MLEVWLGHTVMDTGVNGRRDGQIDGQKKENHRWMREQADGPLGRSGAEPSDGRLHITHRA